MQRSHLILLAFLGLFGPVLFFLVGRGNTKIVAPLLDISKQETSFQPKSETPSVADEISSFSLPALKEKTYDGRDFTVGRILENNAAYTRYYVTYKSGSLTISGIMNVPKGTIPTTGWPVLFLNHGYIDPAIYTNGRGLRREQDYLARQGYAVIHSDYRNHADSDDDPENEVRFRLGYVEDVINAIYAVRQSGLPYLDGERIGLLGHSMGGGVTMNILVVNPELVDGAVLFAPVSADNRDNFERWTKSRPEIAEAIVKQYGAPNDNQSFWDNVSAQTFFDQVKTPILLHHGTADDSVPIEWSDRMVGELKRLNKSVVYEKYPGELHEFAAAWPTVMARTLAFFDTYVKNSSSRK